MRMQHFSSTALATFALGFMYNHTVYILCLLKMRPYLKRLAAQAFGRPAVFWADVSLPVLVPAALLQVLHLQLQCLNTVHQGAVHQGCLPAEVLQAEGASMQGWLLAVWLL